MRELPFTAPLEEQAFVLEHVAGLSALLADPAFAGVTPDLVSAVLEGGGDFAAGVFAPLNRAGDVGKARLAEDGVAMPDGFREAYDAYVAGGWGTLSVPEAYGGQALPRCVAMAFAENLQAANMAFALIAMLTEGGIDAIADHGTREQKDRWLPLLADGSVNATMNLTEPQAGSDVGAVRAKATPLADGRFAITGQKIFITFGEHDLTANTLHLVLARAPDAPAGSRGISMFLVPRFLDDGTPNGVRCIALEEKLGIHASPTCVMSFGEDAPCVGEPIGELGSGLRNMFTMMNRARIAVGVQGIAVGERAMQAALGYAASRVQSPRTGSADPAPVPIVQHPDVRRMILRMRALVQGGRALAIYAAGLMDRTVLCTPGADKRLALLVPLVKARGSAIGCEVADLALQVHGGVGYVEETGVAQYLRDARIATIYEGTNGIQAADLVNRKLGLENGATLHDLLAQIRGDDPPTALVKLVDQIEHAALQFAGGGADDRLAGSAPFLTMLSVAIEGWLMLRQARAAPQNTRFGRMKQAVARFHLDCLVPEASGLGAAALIGADALYALDDESLAA